MFLLHSQLENLKHNYRECSNNKPDIINKPSFWTAFELCIYFIQYVYVNVVFLAL